MLVVFVWMKYVKEVNDLTKKKKKKKKKKKDMITNQNQ
jgi:hypothetical protein